MTKIFQDTDWTGETPPPPSNTINETLMEKIGELKDIVWMVNCKLKSVRAAVELEKSYNETVATWTSKRSPQND